MKVLIFCAIVLFSGCASSLSSIETGFKKGTVQPIMGSASVVSSLSSEAELVCFSRKQIQDIKKKIVDLKGRISILDTKILFIKKTYKVESNKRALICKVNVKKFHDITKALKVQLIKRRFWYSLGIVTALVTGAGAGVLIAFILK